MAKRFRAVLSGVVWSAVLTVLLLLTAVVLVATHNDAWVTVALVGAVCCAILSLRSPG